MTFNKSKILILFLVLFLIPTYQLFAQIEENKAKALLIFYISEYVNWEKGTSESNFTIGVYKNNELLKKELISISQRKKTHNKFITVKDITNVNKITEFDLIILGDIQEDVLENYFYHASINNILLITDNHPNMINSMINITNHQNKIGFIINKQNLYLADLTYKNDLLLYGGTELDVKELYRDAQRLVEIEKQNVEKLKTDNLQYQKRNEAIQEEINTKNNQITAQKKVIELANLEYKKLNDSLNAQRQNIQKSTQLINDQMQKLKIANLKNKVQQDILRNLNDSINSQISLLKNLDNKISNREKLIKKQVATISEKNKLLEVRQRNTLLMWGLIGTLMLFVGAISYAFRQKQKYSTELEQTLLDLKNTQAQLLQSEKMASLGILTAGVAHEINNPLNYIMGAYVGLQNYFKENGSKDEEMTETLLSSIQIGMERATVIVKGLNQFSRDSKSLDEDCNIHSIIDNCLAMEFNKYKHKIGIIKSYNPDDLVIKGNVGNLHQVFLNILDNAIAAIPEKGTITVKTEKSIDKIQIVIADNGIGIASDNLKKVTDPFFTTKDPGKGTGLGLSITYNIIKEHKGNLEFDSKVGEGTTVNITLPNKI